MKDTFAQLCSWVSVIQLREKEIVDMNSFIKKLSVGLAFCFVCTINAHGTTVSEADVVYEGYTTVNRMEAQYT